MKKLTARQMEVLILVGKGLTNSQIAKELIITEHTVKAHLSILYEVLDCSSKVQLTVNALKEKLITLNDI